MIQNSNYSNTHSNLQDFFSFQKDKSNYNVVYTNIRSMRKNFNSFLAEISTIKNHKIHFIVLSEIWIDSDEIQLYSIPGYKLYSSCNNEYRAGGVLCFVENSIDCKHISAPFDMTSADCLLLDVNLNKSHFKLICIYRLQSVSENTFLFELSQLLQEIKNNIIYIGDININLLYNNGITQNYNSIMSSNGLASLVDTPTRITDKSETLIDHIFIRSRCLNLFSSSVFDIGITDHCVLGLKIEDSSNTIAKSVNGFSTGDRYILDVDMVRDKLKNTDWSKVYIEEDVNKCYDIFQDILSNIVKSSNKVVSSNNKLKKAKLLSPWINVNILKKIAKRKKLYKIYKRRPYDTIFVNYFNKFSKDLKEEIDSAKNAFYFNKLESCNGDISKQWRIINNLTGSDKNKSIDKIELNDGTWITEPHTIAQEINKHLISVQSGHSSTVTADTLPPQHTSRNSFFIAPTTIIEVKSVVRNLKNKRSTGFDNFSVKLVKAIIDDIAPVLVHLINNSFMKGIFPESLKLSSVVPILKKSNYYKLDNLRPISLLSVFSKILEKVMMIRLNDYLKKSNFFSNKQFGFIKGKSTESALSTVMNHVFSGLNSKLKTTGLFVDFKKAFDMVDHEILLSKLEMVGIRGVALSWFKSFITGRRQRVKINDTFSDSLIVREGVPQGSTTSATLFLIFINDLLNLDFYGQINAFADDIAFFYMYKDLILMNTYINHDLLLLRKWCNINKMQVNVSKTKFINFDYSGFDFPVPLIFHSTTCNRHLCTCQELEKVKTIKYLGVLIDEKISFEPHILDLHRKLRSQLRKFYFLRNFCNTSLLRSLYFALVNSRLQYALPCWGGTHKSLIEKLRTTQNFFLRIVLKKSKRTSSFPLYQQLNILPIQHLFIFKVLRLFFVRSGNRTNIIQSHPYHMRSLEQKDFKLPKVNKSIFRGSFEYLGPKYFNQLPFQIKNSKNIKQFSRKLITWLFSQEEVDYLNNVIV